MTKFGHRNRPLDVAIIGAGIGGSSAAIALNQAGFDVEVFEQSSALREVGGAILIRDPSRALFHQWGILDALDAKMVKVDTIELRDGGGSIIRTVPVEFESGEGKFAYSVHRADVHDALVSRISPEKLHLGHRLKSIYSHQDYAEATFENGDLLCARMIVGADGLRSVVRSALDQTEMTFMNMVTHRAIAPASLLPKDMPNDRLRMWMSGELKVIILPIRRGDELAIDAVVPAQTPPEKLWSSVPADELLKLYADFDPLIVKLIEGRTVDVTTHPVYDKEPMVHWWNERVVLLGDAAHPMSPMQGQGANQAIQDAGALAMALTGVYRDDISAAFAHYQSVRAPTTDHFQALSRKPPKMAAPDHTN